MIRIFRSQASQLVYLGSSTFVPSEELQIIREGGVFTIRRVEGGINEAYKIPFTDIVDKDNNGFTDADACETYLNSVVQQKDIVTSESVFTVLQRSGAVQSTPTTTTDNSTFVTTLSHTFEVSDTAFFEISATYLWAFDNTTTDIIIQVVLDGQPLAVHRQEPKDAGGIPIAGISGTDQRYTGALRSGGLLTAGPHTVELQMKPSQNGVEATIYQALIAVQRWM